LRLAVAYDGSGFRGMAENRDVRTVAGDLRAALERVLQRPVSLTVAGRTDAGVHARAQVVTAELAPGPPPPPHPRLRDALNSLLGSDVVVTEVDDAPEGFDARRSATSRTYRYHVLDREVPDPFLARTAWWVGVPLDRAAMAEACPPLLGEHDFSSFCRRPRGRPDLSLVRRVLSAEWSEEPEPDLLRFEITATAFCHQMVRSIVGLLVDVGRGRRTPADVTAALSARDRSTAGQLAPPHGLTLWSVAYR
jgi:tRNA pseudouridine38-40 synthase